MTAPWSPSRAREAARGMLGRCLRAPSRALHVETVAGLRLALLTDTAFDTREAFDQLAADLGAPDLLPGLDQR